MKLGTLKNFISDTHCHISFSLTVNIQSSKTDDFVLNPNDYIKWNKNKASEFITEVKNNSLQDLITLIDNPQDLSSEYVLNTIVDNIGTIFVNSAKSVFGKSKVTFKGNNSKFKSWFGKECRAKRKEFHAARKLFNRNKTIVN